MGINDDFEKLHRADELGAVVADVPGLTSDQRLEINDKVRGLLVELGADDELEVVLEKELMEARGDVIPVLAETVQLNLPTAE